ncbi:MAG: hypothetical protein H7096_11445 [Flavobacterium sp.]|nr:hypothetical protein [Pedobacter sp.]
MNRDDTISLLTNLIGSLKMQPQPEDSNFDKFQDMLAQSLAQPFLRFSRTGAELPDQQSYMLPEKVAAALETMTDEIMAAQGIRKPTDPVFWLRQRSLSVTAGVEEELENFTAPHSSFGPFINHLSNAVWFDFFQVPTQLTFEIFDSGLPAIMVITLPPGDPLPDIGELTTLNFNDCTIWVSVKTVAQNGDNNYVGFRAKNCLVTAANTMDIRANGFALVSNPGFEISFEPFDEFATGIDHNAQSKASYPGKISFSFVGTTGLLQSFEKSAVTIHGDSIEFAEGATITPLYLEPEKLIHFPLIANKASWEIGSNHTERFQLNGKAELTDAGWYLPVISTNDALGIGVLGMNIHSGYLGFRGRDGLALGWPGLENGQLKINKFLLLARPGRMNLKYTYDAGPRLKQQLETWKTISGTDGHNAINLKPTPAGEGICIDDNQQMEALIQPVNISVKADRPLNTNQQRFDISGFRGVILFTKIEADTSVFAVGVRTPPAADSTKRRVPQSLCLRNALLTTDNPLNFIAEGRLIENDIITEGSFNLSFPVYRLINTLPDPYISNQEGIFDDAELERFNHLWRTGQDTLINSQVQFSVTAAIQWNEENTTTEFSMNQARVAGKLNNQELSRMAAASGNPCNDANAIAAGNFSRPAEINKIGETDPENIAGAYDFMQMLPGNRSLVDVSGSANLWGVSFSVSIDDRKKALSESVGFPAAFPFRIKNMDLVSSGRMSRLFTLPHIQWEPVMKVTNPLVQENDVPDIINFRDNGSPTRISSAGKNEVALAPKNLYGFIIDGYNKAEDPHALTAHFTLPFGICAFAYFNPKKIDGFPGATTSANEPVFLSKKTGVLSGGMQLHIEATAPTASRLNTQPDKQAYFIGSARQMRIADDRSNNILGTIIAGQFNGEFADSANAKVPLERIDFSGYGASIFSNWQNERANFGRVNQVKFDVLIGRTAHEVIQIKSILFPWGVPVVRSVVMQRKNSGIVTRYDSGWVAQGPGEFDFRSGIAGFNRPEINPYRFHPGLVTGIYNVREIRELPDNMDILVTNASGNAIRFSGVHFNGDIQIENIIKGGLPITDAVPQRVHSAGQFGYVMLADPKLVDDKTTLRNLFPAESFKKLLTNSKIGGSLGGPVNAVMNIAATGQRMQVTRVDVSVSNEVNTSFVVAIRGTIELPKEGSWTVVKCLASNDTVPLNVAEAVPVIRNGLLGFDLKGKRSVDFKNSSHCLGDPAEIDKYTPGAAVPAIQYSLLQTTGTQKLLFRRPSFTANTQQINTEVPDLADAFRLLNCNGIFPNLSKTLSLPDNVKALNITGDGSGLRFDETLFQGPINLNNFTPPQLINDPDAQTYKLIDETDFQVFISYSSKEKSPPDLPPQEKLPSVFQVDLSSDAIAEAAEGERKKWQTVNKDVAIIVNLGSLKPLLTLRGQFRSEAGKDPVFENPECELGDELQAVKDILQVLALLTGKGDLVADSLKVVMANNPDSWNYKMSIEQRIPVIQFPSVEQITLTTPPPLIIEASFLLGVFFNLSLSPDPKNLIKPSAGAVFGFEGMIQIQLITIGVAAAYGVGITKVKAYVDLTNPKPEFDFTLGFGATVIISLPVVGLVSVTRSFSLSGNIDSGNFKAVAGQMLRGVLSLAGGLLVVAIQIEGNAGVERKNKVDKKDFKTTALFEMIFSLDISLAFVISYDFRKAYTEEIALN